MRHRADSLGRQLIVPSQWIGRNHALRLFRLREEEPMIPITSKPPIDPIKMLDDRQAIDHDQLLHHVRAVHCHSKRNIAATVMSDDMELVVAKLLHQVDQRCRLFAFGRMAAVISISRDIRLAEPRDIRANDAKERRQAVSNLTPGHMRAWMSMEKKYRSPLPSRSETDDAARRFHHMQFKTGKHQASTHNS